MKTTRGTQAWPATQLPAVSRPGESRVAMDETDNRLKLSENGGPYQPFGLDPQAALQPDWFINAITGSDDNDGATSLTALASFGEWSRRVGDQLVSIAMNVFVETDLNEPGYDILATTAGAGFATGGFVFIQGTRTVLYSGSITAVTAYDFTTNPIVDGQITDAGLPGVSWSDSGPGGTSLVQKMIVMTSGAIAGFVAFVIVDLGGKVARVSQWFNPLTFAVGTPGGGDTFDVVDVTTLAGGPVRYLGKNLGGNQGMFVVDFEVPGDVAVSNGAAIEAVYPYTFETGIIDGGVTDNALGSSFHLGVEVIGSTIRKNNGFVGVGGGAVFGQYISGVRGAQVGIVADTVAQFIGQPNQIYLSSIGGDLSVSASATYAVFDESRASGGACALGSGGVLLLNGRLASLTTPAVAGFGLWIDSGGTVVWTPRVDLAAAHMTFDALTTIEVDIGGVGFTVAVLAGGSVTAINNAMAVPRRQTPP